MQGERKTRGMKDVLTEDEGNGHETVSNKEKRKRGEGNKIMEEERDDIKEKEIEDQEKEECTSRRGEDKKKVREKKVGKRRRRDDKSSKKRRRGKGIRQKGRINVDEMTEKEKRKGKR
jgi:hypothetical protein